MKHLTFPIYASAYPSLKTCLTHLAEVDEEGYPLRPLCRVKLENLVEDLGKVAEPSCTTCQKHAKRLGLVK